MSDDQVRATQTSSKGRGYPVSADPSEPLVSVVMPCYRETLDVLGRAIDSILGQSYPHIEFIVVLDDPERADAVAFLRERAERDARIRLVVNPENLGVWPSYNRGVREVRGQFIAIQDADDVSLPHRIGTLVAYLLDNPEVDVVGAALEYVDAASGESLMVRRYPESVDTEIRRRCPLAHATTLRKAGLYEKCGYYDESPALKHAADYELWCRWFVQGVRMANVPEPLYVYYQSTSNFKAQNVAAILRDTIAIKRAYSSRLGFTVGDRAYLLAESVAALLPARMIVWLFYILTRYRVTKSRTVRG